MPDLSLPSRDALYDRLTRRGLAGKLGSGDALCLIPYSDGVWQFKPGYYERSLIGNKPGYETADGDRFVIDGIGGDAKSLDGVPVVVCVDPSKHASAVEPIKALIAQKADIGEFVRVDQQGQVVDVGPALTAANSDANGDGVVADGGQYTEEQLMQVAADELYDLTPPALKNDENGGVVDRATGFVVSVSEAARLAPTEITSEDVKLQEDKARVAEHDMSRGQQVKWLLLGAGIVVGTLGVFWFLGQIGGGGSGGSAIGISMLLPPVLPRGYRVRERVSTWLQNRGVVGRG